MGILRERRRRPVGASSKTRSGRLSKRQELALFLAMMGVLVAVIAYGLRA